MINVIAVILIALTLALKSQATEISSQDIQDLINQQNETHQTVLLTLNQEVK